MPMRHPCPVGGCLEEAACREHRQTAGGVRSRGQHHACDRVHVWRGPLDQPEASREEQGAGLVPQVRVSFQHLACRPCNFSFFMMCYSSIMYRTSDKRRTVTCIQMYVVMWMYTVSFLHALYRFHLAIISNHHLCNTMSGRATCRILITAQIYKARFICVSSRHFLEAALGPKIAQTLPCHPAGYAEDYAAWRGQRCQTHLQTTAQRV